MELYIGFWVVIGIIGFLCWAVKNFAEDNSTTNSEQRKRLDKPIIRKNDNKEDDKQYLSTAQKPLPVPKNWFPKLMRDKFKEAVEKYISVSEQINYEKRDLNDHECIIIFQDSLIVYIGIRVCNEDSLHDTELSYFFTNFYIKIEELTYNSLFKFNASAFEENFRFTCIFRFLSFSGLESYGGLLNDNFEYPDFSVFKSINNAYPELQLIKRYNKWEGIKYYFVLFDLFDDSGSVFGVKYSKNPKINGVIRKTYSEILYKEIPWLAGFKDLLEKRNQIIEKLINQGENPKEEIHRFLRYLVIQKMIKEESKVYDIANSIIDDAKNGHYSNETFELINKTESKWKSEQLVYQYCKELFGKSNVEFQYSPLFLHKMSYDVYITEYDVAIEYQGKQHFEPVEFFGGEEHFKAQRERDEKKLKLSKKNNVHLIYINYDEDISKELIIKKIAKSLKWDELTIKKYIKNYADN